MDPAPLKASGACLSAKPLKITVAPNGARRMPSDHPALPITTPRIAETAAACQRAGADEIHLHVRDDEGRHSLDPGRYREAMSAIAEVAPGMTIQITTEAAGLFDVPAQIATLEALRPAAASVSVREAMRAPDLAARLYASATEAGTRLQHILYSHDDARLLHRLIADGTIPAAQRDVLLVLGQYTPPRPGEPSELAPFLEVLGPDIPDWTVCAFGAQENAVAGEAIRRGGDVRIGFENNLARPDGTLAADNAENIARAARAARALGRPLLSEVSTT